LPEEIKNKKEMDRVHNSLLLYKVEEPISISKYGHYVTRVL